MAGTAFAELGLSEATLNALEDLDYEDPTPLQRSAVPVLRRGGSLILRGAPGSGATVALVLGLVEQLAAEPHSESGPRALVISPTAERAQRVATCFARFGSRAGVTARALAPGWLAGGADVIVGTVESTLAAVRESSLKLEQVRALAIESASAVFAVAGAEGVETLLVSVPTDAQRVVVTGQTSREVDRFVQAHVRRALEMPPRPADPALVEPPPPRGELGYLVVAPGGKDQALAELLLGRERGQGETVVIARSSARAATVRSELERRGFDTAEDWLQVVSALDASRAAIAYDVPADADVLARMEAGSGVVLVTPDQLQHLRTTASEAGFSLRALSTPVQAGGLDAYRRRIADAIEGEDLEPQLLVLEPLLRERSAAEVAAALSALLRERAPSSAAAPAGAPAPSSAPPAFTRLFISVGSRDSVRPADIVGAFTGEANISGEQIGRIEIKDTFTVVEVDASVADRVIRALNGTTMRGRSMRVDYDRRTTPPPRRGRPSRSQS